jgi:hypothetical protein
MPLIGLVSLLQSRALRLTRADLFEDQLEGEFGTAQLLNYLGLPEGGLKKSTAAMKRECFVSCWHLSHTESRGMWDSYGKGETSIAVVSDVGKVMKIADDFCADLQHQGMFGDVIYGDLVENAAVRASTTGLPFGYSMLNVPKSVLLLFNKSPFFETEREWRLVIWRRGIADRAIHLPLGNVSDVVRKIIVSPFAPAWIVEATARLVHEQFGFGSITVEQSDVVKHLYPSK